MKPLIEIKKLSISFKKTAVIKNLSLQLKYNECLGLVGRSGEGKSTLLRSIVGLEQPHTGEILFKGENILEWNEEQYTTVRKQISYVFQGGALFDSMTVFDNLAFPLREHTDWTEEKISKIVFNELKEFELEDAAHSFPIEISGGMQKRVAIARATIIKPKVVLYDEPTTGLDPFKKRTLQNIMQNLQKKGTSSMLVTHDMETALRVCNRIALLQDGHIHSIDTCENFKKNQDSMIKDFIHGIKKGERR